MKHLLTFLATLLLSPLVVHAQSQKPELVAEDGGVQERGSSRVLYWNPRADTALGQFAFDYGRPVWKKEYEDPAKFDAMTKGKVWRFGKDFWTSLDTQLALKIGGREVAPGCYYLALHRSPDGTTWSLAFIDPAKVRKSRLDAFQIERAPIEFRIPMALEQTGEVAEKLTVTLAYAKEKPKDVRLRIAWGKIRLVVPIQVSVGS